MTAEFRALRFIPPLLAVTMTTGPAWSDDGALRLGIVAPEEGSLAILGQQAKIAARAFVENSGAKDLAIVPAAEPCSDDTGADAASSMVEAGVDAVIGIFCAETIENGMPILAESNIPAITVSVRSEIVMEDAASRNWPLFRLAPAARAEAEKIAEIIAERWVDQPFALIDDGTIYGRDLVEEIRLLLEARGIEATFMDNYRPAEEKQFGLVRRLADAGATHVFVGGDRTDVAIMARDAAAANLDLTFMGGDAMYAAPGEVPLPDGVLAVLAERRREGIGNSAALDAVARQIRATSLTDARPGDGYFLPVYAAAQIVAAAHDQADSDEPGALVAALEAGTFQTAMGPVHFGEDRAADGPHFTLMVSRNGEFQPAGGEGSGNR